ncbi:hypothetical protein H6F77_09335 [Microcoleus sp. FACHB-831]|uniref:hypothetical protein n=1 Tax=Microcoleus sp. FACHB-831 TaxID=2692827 RepID=UPI00168777B7|nr:hypothetical protein [Microcoleus sp. FACHB-831]MBD1921293.1 hypothetical protein [Microcoleus sp. FACHB-831]
MGEPSINVGGSVGGSIIGGDARNVSSHVRDVSAVINKLPASPETENPGIKELLVQLTAAIEVEPNLSEDDKQEALEQVKALAEAGKNPDEGEMKKRAKGATTMLKGMIFGLPKAANLVEEYSKLLPFITKIFGLG